MSVSEPLRSRVSGSSPDAKPIVASRSSGPEGPPVVIAAPEGVGRPAGRSEPAVAMQAREEEVAEVREEHGREPDDEDERGGPAGPSTLVASVEVDRVVEPRDERGGLLGVPAPVATP